MFKSTLASPSPPKPTLTSKPARKRAPIRQRLARLFTIKTRTEALFVTYAIAVGSIERGLAYTDQYGSGPAGIMLALACLGVPFVAGAKLIDSVKPQPVAVAARVPRPRRPEQRVSRARLTSGRQLRGSAPRSSRRRI